MATKLGRFLTYLEGLQNIKLYNTLIMVLQGHVINIDLYISTTRASMATKLDKIGTCLDGYLLIKSHEPLIRWS